MPEIHPPTLPLTTATTTATPTTPRLHRRAGTPFFAVGGVANLWYRYLPSTLEGKLVKYGACPFSSSLPCPCPPSAAVPRPLCLLPITPLSLSPSLPPFLPPAVLGVVLGGGGTVLLGKYVVPFMYNHSEFLLPFALANGLTATFWYTVRSVWVWVCMYTWVYAWV